MTQLTPAELARVSGVSVDLQRVWRRRGQLASGRGNSGAQARYTPLEAAEVLLRYEMSRIGVGLSETTNIALDAAPVILWSALLNGDGACEVRGPQQEVEALLRQLDDDDVQQKRLSGATKVWRFLWRTNDSDWSFADDIRELTDRHEYASVVFLDLHVMGRLLADRAGRSLVTLEVTTAEAPRSPQVRRVTHTRKSRLT